MENQYLVTKVEVAPARLISLYPYNKKAVMTAYQFVDVCCKIPGAELTMSDEIEDGQRLYTSKLSFSCPKTMESLFYDKTKRFAFRLTLADGSQYVMGRSVTPYPVTTYQRSLKSVTADQMYQYSVEWKTEFPLPQIK